MGRSGSQDPPAARRDSRGLPSSHRVASERRNIVEVGDDESGRCGICSAPVLNRGVLDCCSHVFCFDCIDNWATVSNHCPLCKLQFRFISVESTTRDCNQNGGDQFFPTAVKQEREDEPWGDEEALPFSFPSFFIDEDAVACLDGQRCLIRAGVPVEEDAADTSVACDSCDCWYHAGCVGFDPSISWGSWLCPRCSNLATSQLPPPRSFVPSTLPLTTVVSSSSSGRVPMAELAYDASVSISRADEGESALVFDSRRVADYSILPTRSNQPGKPITTKGCTGQAPIVVKAEEVTFPSLGVEAASCQALGSLVFENQVFEGQELIESAIASNLQSLVEPVGNRPAEVRPSDQKSRDPTNAPSTLFSTGKVEQVDNTQAEVRPSDQKSRVAATDRTVLVSDGRAEQIDFGQVEERSKPDQSEGGKSNDLVARDGDTVFPEASYFDWAAGEAEADREIQEEIKGKKKQAKQDRDSIRAEDLPEPPRKVARTAAKRKEPVHGSSNRVGADKALPSTLKEDNQASGVKETISAVLEECELPYIESAPVEDLMNIVKDEHTGRIASNTASGPRTRIVMRRSTNGNATQLVEDIRQQMRTAAGYGASDDLGKVEVSDDKFFAAFKAALTRTNEQSRGANSHNVKRRRHSWIAKMLDQAPRGKIGGVRGSLTKKLYAGGVSRKTWDRDWDIAFWKERSASLKKARQEAVNVVGRRGGDCGAESRRDGSVVKLEEEALLRLKDPDADSGDSILTRLYVADTSLFPRDNDIKPLLTLKGVNEEGKSSCSVVQEVVAGKPGDLPTPLTRTGMGLIKSRSVSKPGPIAGGVEACLGQLPIPSLQGFGKASSVGAPGKINEGTVTSSVVQYPHQTGHAGGSDKMTCTPSKTSCSPAPSDEKKDKRQWALELLARKSGDATASSSGKCGAGIKKESSLLSQVPDELKPTLPPDRRSRVPTAVRQLQLNRLLEHHLRKAKLASLRGGYKLKSVIAAAVAKEVEIYGNSNSKGVYVNLCVRALSQQDEVRLQVSIPPPFGPGREASITEALLATGLISDSPPGSPSNQQNTSIKGTSEVSKYQTKADVSTSSNALKLPETPVGSGGVLQNSPTSSPVISLATSFMPPFQQDEADDVLELAIPPSVDLYTDLDLDLEEFDPSGIGSKLSESVPSCVDSSSKKVKVLLTKDMNSSPSEVLGDWHNLPKEAGLTRETSSGLAKRECNSRSSLLETKSQSKCDEKQSHEQIPLNARGILWPPPANQAGTADAVNKSLESKNFGTPTLQPSASENVREGTTVFLSSPEGSEGMKVENCEKSRPILNQSRETQGQTSTDKVEKTQQISANTIPSRDREGSKESNSKEAKVENTTADPAETYPAGEFEGDDWMRSGKFPDLESRIDKMRKDVLQMNSTFLSQFGEAHVFGGSIERPSSIFEKMQDGGFEGHTSVLENYGKSEGRLDTAVPDGPEGKAVRQSVRKQVESYVKEHLKPLYKSGVIKAEQFRYAVSKTASKVMQHHGNAKSADFLILEGSKVKKLADQYLQAFVHRK